MIYAIVAAVVILLIVSISKSRKQRKGEAARRRAEQEKREAAAKRQEAARKEYEEQKRRDEESKLRAEKIKQDREAAIKRAMAGAPGSEKYRLEKMEEEFTAHVLTITEFTPISKKRFVVVDTETTGLSSVDDSIIELAAVRVENGVIGEMYQQLVDPEIPIPEAAGRVNHITDDMVKGKPRIYEALPGFLTFIGDDVVAAHNARFDAQFIAQACLRNRFKAPGRYFDTMALSRYWPEAANKKQQTLLQAAGIENQSAHRALGDAYTLAQFILATNERRKSGKAS